MLKGLRVIWRHWGRSWLKKLEKMSDTDGIFTVQYPEEQLVLPEASRNMPILLYDDETGHELCTSCFQCERICPPQVIHMTQAKDPNTGKPVPAVVEFIIEYDACMGCGLCAEVCPFDSIKMDHAFELSTHDHPSMTVHKKDLMRPVSYYQSIAPTMWEEAKSNAYKKLEGSKKRRTGNIGISPTFKGAKPAKPAAAPKAAAPKAAAPKAAAPKAAAPKAAAGGAGYKRFFTAENIMGGIPANTKMSEEKKAKLRSIREGNLQKRG
jgi:formate hydrogenlyase subunit 6/NADH:ubiquinone oxidoreductase subunit I